VNRLLSTREEYGRTLVRLGERSHDVVVLDGDRSSSTCTRMFAERFPDRFYNMGISEQDLIGTAAGMSLAGKIAFASSFAVFITGRCWEQIRQSVALHPLDDRHRPGRRGGDPQGRGGRGLVRRAGLYPPHA
jgi:transketolase